VLLLHGRAAVLEASSLLEKLALRCGQSGAMHWMQFFLDAPESQHKRPHLVLVTHSRSSPRALRLENVRAAVLVLEYCVLGLPTGIYVTPDSSAFRTVIAPPGERASVAALAAQVLLQEGAEVVVLSCDEAGKPMTDLRQMAGVASTMPVAWARRRRPVARTLALESSYEATLKKMGKSTRFNLGYYRRRLESKMPCVFVSDARGMLSEADLRAVNAASLNPVSHALMRLQYQSACHLPGGFLLGLRGPLGQWLSLIGGWRQAESTVLYWQTNASGYERSSLGTVMRSYFLEHEIGRGARAITFYGGTPHTMQHAFLAEQVNDLVMRRLSWKAAVLMTCARAIAAVQRRTKRLNFVVGAMSDPALVWRRSQPIAAGDPQGRPAGSGSDAALAGVSVTSMSRHEHAVVVD
jgi:hypothetical protein